MPNTGKPSPNCHLCRQRRVKCDLGRPQCQRCIKYGVPCPGYRDDQDLRFQHADSASFGRRRREKQRPQGTPDSDSSELIVFTPESTASPLSPPSSRYSSRSSSPTPPLLKTVRQHWTTESVPLVLGIYSHLDFLPGLFKGVGPNHCLVLTGHIFTRAYIINRYRPETDYKELSSFVGKALSSVSTALQNPKRYMSDATIVAVWLLGNYELLMGGFERRSFVARQERRTVPDAPWHIHSNGLLSLLRARGDRQLYDRSGRQIFWTMHSIIQIQNTITNSPCPPEFDHWVDILERTPQRGEALLLRTGRYISSASLLLSRLMPIARQGDTGRACAEYGDITAACDAAELAMLEWARGAPEYRTEAGPVYGYFWNTWRSARIKLHYMMILLANVVEHAPDCPFEPAVLERRRGLSTGIIAATARDIVDSIPRSLGGKMPDQDPHSPATFFDAARLVWPLSHLYVIPVSPRDLRIVARDTLLRIARERGILTALKPRAGGLQFPAEALKGIPVDNLDGLEGDLPNFASETGAHSPGGR